MHEPSSWAMFTKCSFDKTENKLDYYRGIDCIKILCKKLNNYAMKIINYEEKEMIPLSKEKNKSCEGQEECHICKKKFFLDKNEENEMNKMKMMKNEKSIKKLKIIVITPGNLEELLIVITI